jgi:uncharacterized membrane protein YfcA
MERLWPFLIGGVVGVPIGVELLRAANPAHVRWTVGVLLIAFVFWSIVRPTAVIARGGRLADGGVAVASGVVGGLTGLGGILATVWCSLRGWPKDQQRAVFQPVAVVIFLATIAWLGGSGAITREIVGLILAGLPAVLIGVWAGMKLYGRLSETGFRAVVLALLFISGAALLLR